MERPPNDADAIARFLEEDFWEGMAESLKTGDEESDNDNPSELDS